MINFYKYFPPGEKGQEWGLNILNVGCTRILPNSHYPAQSHPSHHNFKWETGRVLQEYALVYIVNGTGSLETESVNMNILDGTVFMIFPNERHRYKPDLQTGWDEYWVSFNGDYIENLMQKKLFSKKYPLFQLGLNEKILGLFNELVEASVEESNGFESILSSATIHALGVLHAFNLQKEIEKDSLALLVVKKAKMLFRTNLLEVSDPKAVAVHLGVGYSWFRKVFKENTGRSPGQYFIQLKIQKSKELLANHQLSIKEIAYMLGFKSPFYFSKLFKRKTGLTPVQFRNLRLKKY
ncbi:AraC family transcriptional regulator [Pedobacter sp. Leaf194]|uniref:AraC family transcriptional regulator n=1 Tax=Pedobacter sp. Leaf194 TaxID=1736297 RepID=UPI000702FFE5|nr:AraC family transcriptional regulator [Pedobacter sp. Leaf194]KQS36767.1 hypothetical protein ASG14_06935 [Pedobacter sp. Leaf194]